MGSRMADDDTVIALEPDGSTSEGKANGAASDDALAELQKQYDDIQRGKQASDADAASARQREADARAEAIRARNEAQAARSEAADTHLSAIETSLTAQQTARDAAKVSYKQAMDAGNWDAAAEAQERLATAAANIARLSDTKEQIESRRESTQRTETGDDAARSRPIDPVEAFIQSRAAPSQTWLRSNQTQAQALGRHFAGVATAAETKIALKILAADNDARAEGVAVDTPEYFEHLEKFTGMKKAEEKPAPKPNSGETRTEVRAHTRRQSVPAAPVNGGGSGSSGGSSEAINVRLTKGQAESAQDGTHVWLKSDLAAGRIKDATMVGKPIGLREMARRVHEMNKERPGIFENGNVDQ